MSAASAPRCTIRDATARDAAAVRAIYAPFIDDGAVTFEVVLPSEQEMARRIDDTRATHPYLVAVDDDDTVQGYAYAGPFRARAAYAWVCEVSVYVDARHRGRGVARALYEALFRALALQGFASTIAVITVPNPTSIAFHTALGFVPCGTIARAGYKHGAWHDVAFAQRALSDDGAAPSAPVAAHVLRGTAAWQEALTGRSTGR